MPSPSQALPSSPVLLPLLLSPVTEHWKLVPAQGPLHVLCSLLEQEIFFPRFSQGWLLLSLRSQFMLGLREFPPQHIALLKSIAPSATVSATKLV